MRYLVRVPLEPMPQWDSERCWITIADCESPDKLAAVVLAVMDSPSECTLALRVERVTIRKD